MRKATRKQQQARKQTMQCIAIASPFVALAASLAYAVCNPQSTVSRVLIAVIESSPF